MATRIDNITPTVNEVIGLPAALAAKADASALSSHTEATGLVQDGTTLRRCFEHGAVTVDCAARQGRVE